MSIKSSAVTENQSATSPLNNFKVVADPFLNLGAITVVRFYGEPNVEANNLKEDRHDPRDDRYKPRLSEKAKSSKFKRLKYSQIVGEWIKNSEGWWGYEEKHEPGLNQSSSTINNTATSPSSLSHQQKKQSHQILDVPLSHSRISSSSHQLDNNNMRVSVLRQKQQSVDLKSEAMDISVSPVKDSRSKSQTSVKEIRSISHEQHVKEHNYSSLSDLFKDPGTENWEQFDKGSSKDKDTRKNEDRAPKKRKRKLMDSYQSYSTRLNPDINLLKNQAMRTSNSEKGEVAMTKRRKEEEEAHPLKMLKILGKIFSFLDVNSIKNARLVSPLWSAEGAKSLITKCYVQIKDLDLNEMSKFNVFLSLQSRRSMISSITIGTLGDFDVWHSLGVLGPQVEAVKLKCIDDEAKLLRKLLNVLPNLKYLNFQVPLFHVYNVIDVFKSVMSKKEKKGTTLVISSMTLSACSVKGLTKVEKFSNCSNIMIQKLEFDFNPELLVAFEVRLAKIVCKFLSTNRSTLKRLTLNNCHLFLALLEFPCMTALTHLDLDFNPKIALQMSRCKFPPSFKFLEKIPNLQEICMNDRTVSILHPSSGFLKYLFGNTGPVPSVKCVKCFRDHASFDIEFFFKMFPNVEDLQICVDGRSPSWFHNLWRFGTKLRKLRLLFDLDQLLEKLDLDSIFTGFPSHAVRKIKNNPYLNHYTLHKLKELRSYPSILNLKELEEITIELKCHDPNHLPKEMLSVTAKYAFLALPKNPKISIHVKDGYGLVHAAAMEALDKISQLPTIGVLFI